MSMARLHMMFHDFPNPEGIFPSSRRSLKRSLKDFRMKPRKDWPFISRTSRRDRISSRTVLSGSLRSRVKPPVFEHSYGTGDDTSTIYP